MGFPNMSRKNSFQKSKSKPDFAALLKMLVLLLLALGSNVAKAAKVAQVESCNASGKQCIVSSPELITGDRVGFFSSDDRLVAYGRVQKMAGKRRIVGIDKAYSSVSGGERVALLSNVTDPTSIEELYTIQRNQGRRLIDATVASASFSIGPGAAGIEATGAWITRSWQDLELTGRAMFTTVAGEVSVAYVERDYLGHETRGVDVQSFDANIYSGLAGLGYTLYSAHRVSFRGEIDAGLAYVAGVVGESDMSESSGFPTKITNGFGLVTRGTATAMVNLANWHVGVSLGQTNIQEASAATFGLSVSKSLD